MLDLRFVITSPVRSAQTEDHKYLLFNTRNFKLIYVGDSGYVLWKYMSQKKELSAKEIAEFMKKEFNMEECPLEDVFTESRSFLDFLMENDFIKEAYGM